VFSGAGLLAQRLVVAWRHDAQRARHVETGLDAESLDGGRQLARRRFHGRKHLARGAPAGPRFELAVRLARFAREQPRRAARSA
jgi:hypothetical protein